MLCQGCHESRHHAPAVPKQLPIALRRAPSRIKPDVDGSNPFSYPRLVQPVLEKHCVKCHEENKEVAPRLDSEVVSKGRNKWYASYHSLARDYGFWSYGDRHRTTPGKFGARASKLYELLKDGDHYDVNLLEAGLASGFSRSIFGTRRGFLFVSILDAARRGLGSGTLSSRRSRAR